MVVVAEEAGEEEMKKMGLGSTTRVEASIGGPPPPVIYTWKGAAVHRSVETKRRADSGA